MGLPTENGFLNYRHIRLPGTEHIAGAVTLRIEVDQENEKITVSWAVCNPKDQFSKNAGRKIADKALEEGRYVTGQYLRAFTLAENALIHMENRRHCQIDDELLREIAIAFERISDIQSF